MKKQISEYFGKKYLNKILPIYEGLNKELLNVRENASLNKKFKKPFFVYVGNFYPHKNVDRLILAFSSINTGVQLILVGPDDFFTKRTSELIDKLNLNKKIKLFFKPSLEDFVYFYKNALALVHPSLAEGFGLPLAEAMHFNLPIIASNIGVFREVLDDKYISFDPYNIGDIKDKIVKFLRQKSVFDYSKLRKKYSFEEMTKKTLEVYNKTIV